MEFCKQTCTGGRCRVGQGEHRLLIRSEHLEMGSWRLFLQKTIKSCPPVVVMLFWDCRTRRREMVSAKPSLMRLSSLTIPFGHFYILHVFTNRRFVQKKQDCVELCCSLSVSFLASLEPPDPSTPPQWVLLLPSTAREPPSHPDLCDSTVSGCILSEIQQQQQQTLPKTVQLINLVVCHSTLRLRPLDIDTNMSSKKTQALTDVRLVL